MPKKCCVASPERPAATCDGQAAGVGGEDGVGAAVLRDLFEQSALDVEVLGDGFDDPVAVGDQGEIVVEVADGEEARGVG